MCGSEVFIQLVAFYISVLRSSYLMYDMFVSRILVNVLNKYVLTVLILDDLCIFNRFDFRRSLYILTVSVLGYRYKLTVIY